MTSGLECPRLLPQEILVHTEGCGLTLGAGLHACGAHAHRGSVIQLVHPLLLRGTGRLLPSGELRCWCAESEASGRYALLVARHEPGHMVAMHAHERGCTAHGSGGHLKPLLCSDCVEPVPSLGDGDAVACVTQGMLPLRGGRR